MAANTIGAVWDRISSIVATQGFARAVNPFDFDQQPDGNLDVTFTMSSARVGTQGYIGSVQAEQHRVTIYLARRVKRDGWGAARQLKSDVDLLEQTMVDDNLVQSDYLVTEVTSEVRPPASADFAIGQLEATVDFDRQLM